MKTSYVPGLSVIVLCRDRQEYAKRAFNSVIYQCKAPFEVIISDNSKNRAIDLASKMPEGVLRRYIRQSGDLSSRDHMRKAVETVRTSHFMFLHDDDELEPNYVSRVQEFLTFHPNFSAVGTNAFLLSEAGWNREQFPSSTFVESDIVIRSRAVLINLYTSSRSAGVPPFSSFAYRTEAFQSTPFTSLDTEYYDAIFLADLLGHGPLFLMEERLFKVRVHNDRITSKCKVKDYKIYFNWAKPFCSTSEEKNALESYRLANVKAQLERRPTSFSRKRMLVFIGAFLGYLFSNPDVRHRALRYILSRLCRFSYIN